MSKNTRRPKPVVIDVDMKVVGEVLERARAALSSDDHACLAALVTTFIDISKLVRERGTTIARLRRLFGLATSEKTADVFGGTASSSGGDANDASVDDGGADADAAVVNGGDHDHEAKPERRARKGHGRIGVSQYLNAHRITVEHPHLEAGNVCPDCAHGKLHPLAEPARILRIVGQPPLAAVEWDCERLRCGGCGTVFTALAPEQARGPKYDASAVSMMALLRYGAGMPLYRLDRLQKNLDTPVPASSQWEAVRDHVSAVAPAYDELRRVAAQGRVIHNDDTSVRILEFMGKRRAELVEQNELPGPERTGLFTTGVISITDVGPVALFFSGRKHAGENLDALLVERDDALCPPIQMGDGLDRNVPSEHDVVESNCLVHGRRHIVDEVENFPVECRHVLEALRKVFKNESTCIEEKLSAQARLELHQRESGPVMTDLETWLKTELDDKRVEQNSALGNAFRYLLKRWSKLTLFLRVPNAPIENNICERALKMAIRHRKNSLFYRSQRGAKVADIFMALIYTAELHDENPFEYLVALLEHDADVAANPTQWLPWTFRATLARLASLAVAA